MVLGAPHSTGEVATTLGLAAATASHHLTTLRDAGLVAADRVGRRMEYARTPVGDLLAQPA
jgi:DNA-binding transcriptional ArsR family regulator